MEPRRCGWNEGILAKVTTTITVTVVLPPPGLPGEHERVHQVPLVALVLVAELVLEGGDVALGGRVVVPRPHARPAEGGGGPGPGRGQAGGRQRAERGAHQLHHNPRCVLAERR